ncbi:unnamed protein product [Didymodactylos carnosus]|uniref:N-acetyltransferase domain-containing protein n=1 Tax=Didymodactylos carnosus TaxID=1234261 RepID=A0A813PK11_9BILA|nr:unnamed protein product [Didymodactylos carnosus]CAF0754567.1 unnamed protein product [Didymodactylos carnosus]CAF3511582.1 unnamed protein product [Didymodactylos carnosus]CAF3534754.1 unnamed protein product [Didymodactylos carnosus]
MTLTIRRMKNDDLNIVTEIEKVVWPDDPWTHEDFIDSNNPWCYCWVLEEKNELIGYSMQYFDSDMTSHIANICIKPERQRQGLGKIMLNHLIYIARLLKAISISLEVNATNSKALHLYKAFGFEIIDFLKDYYPTGDAYKMKLHLLTNRCDV